MNGNPNPIGGAKEMTRQVHRRLAARRNRRIVRNALLVLMVTAVMTVLAILNRDKEAMRHSYRAALQLAAALQREHDEHGRWPTSAPRMPLEDAGLGESYDFNVLYPGQIRTARIVGVCHPRNPLGLFLRADGRHVITFDGYKYSVVWILESEFRGRANSLGF